MKNTRASHGSNVDSALSERVVMDGNHRTSASAESLTELVLRVSTTVTWLLVRKLLTNISLVNTVFGRPSL